MKVHTLSHGFDAYLSKPINVDQLKSIVTQWKQWGQEDLKRTPIPNKAHQLLNSNTHKIRKVVDIKMSLERSNHNKKLAKDMLALLINMLQEEEEKVTALYESQAWKKLYQLNHKLYGGSAYCGTPELQAANQKLERLLQHQCLSETEKTIISSAEKVEIEKAVEILKQRISDLLHWHEEHDIEIIFSD